MKKSIILNSFLIGVVLSGLALATPRLNVYVQKVSQNNGDYREGFLVSITSSSWTSILSADEDRRYAIIHATSTSITEVCLSTISAAATTCTATLPGRHIPNVGIVVEDWNEAPLYARGIAASDGITATSINLMGEKQKDSRD